MAKKQNKEKKSKKEKKEKKAARKKEHRFLYDHVLSALGGVAILYAVFCVAAIVFAVVFALSPR